MQKVYCCILDGFGGGLLAAQAASFIEKTGKEVIFLVPSRDEIYKPFKYLLEDKYQVIQTPESLADKLLSNQIPDGYSAQDEIYLIYPDGLYLNPFAFDYKKYNTNPQIIRSTRILTHKFKPKDKQIYVGLISSTSGYTYENISELLYLLGTRFSDYTFHFPILHEWAGIKIKQFNLDKVKELNNVKIYENDSIFNQLDLLYTCCYCICSDNGISHVSYNLGQNRLLLDPRFGYGRESLMWRARWRETDEDSIRISSFPEEIADLVSINLKIPQTNLLPKSIVMNNRHENWSRELGFKF